MTIPCHVSAVMELTESESADARSVEGNLLADAVWAFGVVHVHVVATRDRHASFRSRSSYASRSPRVRSFCLIARFVGVLGDLPRQDGAVRTLYLAWPGLPHRSITTHTLSALGYLRSVYIFGELVTGGPRHFASDNPDSLRLSDSMRASPTRVMHQKSLPPA
jgi:hypothetical protein